MGAAAATQFWPALGRRNRGLAVRRGLLRPAGPNLGRRAGQDDGGPEGRERRQERACDGLPFILSFVALFVMAMALAGILFHTGYFTLRGGMISGALVWFGFILTSIAVNNAFSSRRPMLTIIDAGHWLGALLVIGAVLGLIGG